MKLLFIVLLSVFCCVEASSQQLLKTTLKFSAKPLEMVPDNKGGWKLVAYDELCRQVEMAPAFDVETDIKFNLLTRNHPLAQPIYVDDDAVLAESSFDPTQPTRIVVHGWNGGPDSAVLAQTPDAFLGNGDFNIVTVDWSMGATTIDYSAARNRVEDVGRWVARMVDFLARNGNDVESMTIIGHSLGAHVSGMAGKFMTSGKVGTVVGLDPAGPLFSPNLPAERLDGSDADYVEIIHSDGDYSGIGYPIGQADFFPNGGMDQPGCWTIMCDHGRSTELYIESINNHNFWARRCTDFDELQRGTCIPNGPDQRMGGEPSNRGQQVNGVFYLSTNSVPLFARG